MKSRRNYRNCLFAEVILLFLTAVLFAGCAGAPVQSAQPPEESTRSPTDPEANTIPGKKLGEQAVEKWRNLLSNDNAEGYWYRRALTSYYASPMEVDLLAFFYDGFPDRTDTLTEEELEFLKERVEEDLLRDYLSFDFYRLNASEMNEVTMQYLGISFQPEWERSFAGTLFDEQNQTFYLFKTDTNASAYQVQEVYRLEDGNIGVIYAGDLRPDVRCLAVFRDLGDRYQPVFHWPLDGYAYYKR